MSLLHPWVIVPAGFRLSRLRRFLRPGLVVAGVIVFLLVTSAFVGIRYWIRVVHCCPRAWNIGGVARVLELHIAEVRSRVIHVIDTAQRIPTRLAFDNHDYPEHLIAQVWVDNATEGYVVDAHCTRDRCETAPLMMRRGRRHTIQIRVIIGDRMSAFTETIVDR